MSVRGDGVWLGFAAALLLAAILGGLLLFQQRRLAEAHLVEARLQAQVQPENARVTDSATLAATLGDSAAAAPETVREAEALASALEQNAALAARVAELEAELDIATRERLDREMEWIDFTKAIGSLSSGSRNLAFTKELLSDTPGALEEPPAEPSPEELARAQRSKEILNSLRALMRAEWVHGLDLLDAGTLSDDGWIGPVVFRMLDAAGRLSGGLVAPRMRLEGSRSGHVVTLVLEGGSESHGGIQVPFQDGVRRMMLPGIDPVPWIDALPELFQHVDTAARDDGRWDLARIKRALNERLAEDATGDVFRFRHVGGVIDGVLQDVHLSVADSSGHTSRHLFADRCRIEWHDRGARLTLEDGVTMRGDSRAPFLEGRYRIFLPRARRDAWDAAVLPGLADAPAPAR